MSRPPVPPQMRRLPDGGAIFRVPYHDGWVSSLKVAVPPWQRDWDPASKTWAIAPEHVPFVMRLSKTCFGRLAEVAVFSAPAGSGDPWRVLHLRETAPPELIEAAFRVLSKAAHPDAGGSHEQMLALAAARDACRQMT